MAFFSRGLKLPKSINAPIFIDTSLHKQIVLLLKQYVRNVANSTVEAWNKVNTKQLIAITDTRDSLQLYAAISMELSGNLTGLS